MKVNLLPQEQYYKLQVRLDIDHILKSRDIKIDMDPCDCPCFNTRKAAGCVSIIYLLPWPISFLNAFVNNKILVFLGSSVNWPAIDIDTPCWCPQENAICGYVIIFCLRIPCKANTYHQAFSQSYAHLPWYNIKQLFYHESQGGVDNLLCE